MNEGDGFVMPWSELSGSGEPIVRIPLVHGGEAVIDEEDYCLVDSYRWRRVEYGGLQYAVASVTRDRVYTSVMMHRVIYGLTKEDRVHVDHINHDGLDNRRCNLRLATPKQNAANSRRKANSPSSYKGVWRANGLWISRIETRKGGVRRSTSLGYYQTEEEAAVAYRFGADHLRDRDYVFAEPVPASKMPTADRLAEIRSDVDRRIRLFLAGRKVRPGVTSGYHCVFQNRQTRKWYFMFRHTGKTLSLGPFASDHEAAWAYNVATDHLGVKGRRRNTVPGKRTPSAERQAVIVPVTKTAMDARMAGVKGSLPNRFALTRG